MARERTNTIAILYPRDVDSNSTVTLCVSERKFATASSDSPADQPFKTRLVPGLVLSQSLFGGGRLNGDAVGDVGQLRIQNADHGVDSWLEYSYGGRRVWIGTVEKGQTLAQATTVYDGTMGEIEFQGSDIVIPLRGKEEVLSIPVQSKVYGPHATALYFNEGGGTGDRIELPSAANPVDTSQWTIEAWVRHERGAISGNRGGLFRLADGSAQADFYCYYGSSVSGTQLGMWSTVTWEGYNLRDGLWHHVAYVRRGDDGYIYLDGEQVATGDVSGSAPGTAVAGVLSVGDSTYEISAEIAEVRVWSTALSVDDIKGRRYRALNGDESGLLSYYRLNEGANVLGDDTAYVFDSASTVAGAGYASITGTPTWEVTGHSREGHEGKRMPLPVGKVQLFEPDLVDSRTNTYRVSSDAVAGLEVFEGGRLLSGDAHLATSSSSDGVVIADDTATDFSSGDRTVLIDFTTNDLSATQQLYHATSGSVAWDWSVSTAGAVSIGMTDNSGASATLTTDDGLIESGGRYDLRVTMSFDGPLRLYVNGVQQGNVALPTAGANFNPTAVYIGRASGGGSVLQGKLWSFAQWDYIQTQAEIQDRLHERLTAGETGLEIGYRLDEGSGTTATDIGSEGLNGTIQGTWTAAEYTLVNDYRGCYFSLTRTELQPIRCRVAGWLPVGRSIQDDYTVSHDSAMQVTGDITVFAWYRWADDGVTHHIFKRRSVAAEGSFNLRENGSNELQWIVDPDVGTVNIKDSFTGTAGNWYAVAGVFEGQVASTIYLDGEEFTTAPLGSQQISANAVTEDLDFLGGTDGDNAMTGAFWFNRALTQAEIRQLMYQPLEFVDDADLVGCWPMNEGEGDTVYDVGLNSLDGSAGTSGFDRLDGPKPLTATALSQHLVLRDANTQVNLGDVDSDSVDTYETRAGSATVGTFLRDESHLESVSRLIAPNGWTTFDANGNWKFGQLWAPNVHWAAQFDGSTTVTVTDDPSLRIFLTGIDDDVDGIANLVFSGWVRIDQIPSSDAYVIWKENNYAVRVTSTGKMSLDTALDFGTSLTGTGSYQVDIPAATIGGWHHWVISGAFCFIDGVDYSGSISVTAYSPSHTGSYEDLIIGDGFKGSLMGLSLWQVNEIGPAQIRILPSGEEAGLIFSAPLNEENGTAAEDRSANGNDGAFNSEPERSTEPVYWLEGDGATAVVTRNDYVAGSLRQSDLIAPTASERVEYRERFEPYRRSELVGVALESPLVSSDMTRPFDELLERVEESRSDFLLAIDGDGMRTPLAERDDAAAALATLSANYGQPRKVFVVDSLKTQFGNLGEKLRVDATRRDGTTEWNLPNGGKDFIVIGITWQQDRDVWQVELWG